VLAVAHDGRPQIVPLDFWYGVAVAQPTGGVAMLHLRQLLLCTGIEHELIQLMPQEGTLRVDVRRRWTERDPDAVANCPL